jgi:outer membrane receptor protein involved in Fe transport
MRRSTAARFGWLAPQVLGVFVVGATAGEPPAPPRPAPIQQVQLPIPEAPNPEQPLPQTAPTQAPAAAPAIQQMGLGTNVAPRAESNSVSPTGTSVALAGQASPVAGSSDLSELLSKSPSAAGVEVQRRNAIISDPRVRGERVGQVVTYGDGGLFFPARQDLDVAISKFDPGSVRDILILKGPYSVLYGPGFSFLDVETIDAPRYPNGYETHGRTSLGYQTNGQRFDGLQSVFGGDKDFGYRVTYNLLVGNDYRDGNHDIIRSSYNSQNVNYAVGYDLTCDSKVEFKGLYVYQHDVEFPGLYFDIGHLTTEAYSTRYTLTKQAAFDTLTLDAWYNSTAAQGDTHQPGKQRFLTNFLTSAFAVPLNGVSGPPFATFNDFSTTDFGERSIGYRLAVGWGQKDTANLTVGTDLNVLGQGLFEYIRINQNAGANVSTGVPVTAPTLFTQNQSIPNSQSVDPGIFAELSMPLTDRLKFKTGGRFDWVHETSDPRLITGNVNLFGAPQLTTPTNAFSFDPIIYSSNPADNNLTRDFQLFSAYLSGEYKLDEHLTAQSSYGYAMRAPTQTELYAAGPFVGVLQQGLSRLIGDPSLAAERLNQFDVGLKADYAYFKGGVTGFYAYVDNYITFDQNKGGTGITQVVFTNTDEATLAGAELFGQVDLTGWLTPFGSLSYVQGEDRTHADTRRPPNLASSRRNSVITGESAAASEALAQIPPLEGRVGLRFHEAQVTPKWQVELSARMVAGQNNVASSLGEQTTPGFTIFDLRSYWQVTEKLLLTAGVENLGDRFYREHLDPIAGNAFGDPLFRQGYNFYFSSQLTY